MIDRPSVESLKAKLLNDLRSLEAQGQQIQGAIAACDKLIADDEALKAAEKAKKTKNGRPQG